VHLGQMANSAGVGVVNDPLDERVRLALGRPAYDPDRCPDLDLLTEPPPMRFVSPMRSRLSSGL
jgi:hypothetical protein